MNHLPPTTADTTEEIPQMTPVQLARRKQWAIIVCLGAQNETSKRLAQRLCRQWFPNCECVRDNEWSKN